MNMTKQDMEKCARITLEAERSARSIPPLMETWTDLTSSQAYDIQIMRNRMAEEEGHRIVGAKMGSTSLAKLSEFGYYSPPEYGRLFDYMELKEEQPLVMSELIHPKVEAELAFITKKDLCGPNISAGEALAATECVMASIEIIDSRYHNFTFADPDGEADNLSAARFKLGTVAVKPDKLDLVTLGVRMNINGEYTGFGAAGAVLGHPARSLAMLVNLLYEKEMELKAGQVVLTGAVIASRKLYVGDKVSAEFEQLGNVRMDVV